MLNFLAMVERILRNRNKGEIKVAQLLEGKKYLWS